MEQKFKYAILKKPDNSRTRIQEIYRPFHEWLSPERYLEISYQFIYDVVIKSTPECVELSYKKPDVIRMSDWCDICGGYLKNGFIYHDTLINLDVDPIAIRMFKTYNRKKIIFKKEYKHKYLIKRIIKWDFSYSLKRMYKIFYGDYFYMPKKEGKISNEKYINHEFNIFLANGERVK